MRSMPYLHSHPKTGIYQIIIDVPEDARHAFGGKRQVWRTTGERDKGRAIQVAPGIIADIKGRITEARAAAAPRAAPALRPLSGDDPKVTLRIIVGKTQILKRLAVIW